MTQWHPVNAQTAPMIHHDTDDTAATLARRIREAHRIVALTGAGMSAESGIPTFRGGDDGLWSRFDPMRLATPEAFAADPDLCWGWYAWRTALVANAQPNAGHNALAWLATHHPDVRVVTQNVDDLHERAGSPHIVHLHGSLFRSRCFDCHTPYTAPTVDPARAEQPCLRVPPPRCAHCDGPIRPGVVWFGEELPEADWRTAKTWLTDTDLVLVIGTSGQVYPAASLAGLARQHGAFVAEINPAGSGQPHGIDLLWRATAATALQQLRDILHPATGDGSS